MRSWIWIVGMALAGCDGRPERVDPNDFPSSRADTGLVPMGDEAVCGDEVWVFEADTVVPEIDLIELDFFDVPRALSGYSTFTYRSVPEPVASILMTECEGVNQAQRPSGRTITLTWFGTERIRAGAYEVSREAKAGGGFLFAFQDASNDGPRVCADQPEGKVNITRSEFGRLKGTFEVRARCVDDDVRGTPPRRPQYATFSGSFDALNVGNE